MVKTAEVDETPHPGEPAEAYVRRLAEAKARRVADGILAGGEEAVVIGADTTVVCHGEILGKPADAADARRILNLLSGRTHEVLTGLALHRLPDGQRASHVESTLVTFVPLTNSDIGEYIASGEPFDKAGAYGIQGLGGKFVSRIEGCYFNVMGLPVSRLWQMLRRMKG